MNEEEHRALGDVNALEKLYIVLCAEYSKKLKEEEDYLVNNPEKISQMLFIN